MSSDAPLQLSLLSDDRFVALRPRDLTQREETSVVRLALALLAQRHQRGVELTSPESTKAYLQLLLSERKNEVFGAIFLDNRHRIVGVEELFYGTVDGASVHPRVVVQRAMDVNAAACIFFHNHPSGVAEPSTSDRSLTKRLEQALALVDVCVLDHLVVAAEGTVSFAERGLL